MPTTLVDACSKTQFVETVTINRTRDASSLIRTKEAFSLEKIVPQQENFWTLETITFDRNSVADIIVNTVETATSSALHNISVDLIAHTTENAYRVRDAAADSITNTTDLAEVDIVASQTISSATADSVWRTDEAVAIEIQVDASCTTNTKENTSLEKLLEVSSVAVTVESADYGKSKSAESITNSVEAAFNSSYRIATADDVFYTNETTAFTRDSSVQHEAICVSVSSATAEVASSSETTADATSIIYAIDYSWDIKDRGGFLARTGLWAHSTHSLPAVEWAYGDMLGYSNIMYKLSGERLDNVVLLPQVPGGGNENIRPQELSRLDTMWIIQGADKKTTVHDGKHLRNPMVRDESVRFTFGKGKTQPTWDLTINNINYLESVRVQLNTLSRRI